MISDVSFYGAPGCPVCETWLEVLPIDVLAAFELWQVRKKIADELQQKRNQGLCKLDLEKKVKLAAENYYSDNFVSLGYSVYENKVAERILTLSNFDKRQSRSSYRQIQKKCAQIRRSFFSNVSKPEGIEERERQLEHCALLEYPFELDIAFTMSLVLPEKKIYEDKINIPIKKQVRSAIIHNFPEVKGKETISRLSTAILSTRDNSVRWFFSVDGELAFSGVSKKKR